MTWEPGIEVVHSTQVPKGQFYLMPRVEALWGDGDLTFVEVPGEPRWEAVQIVQDGMADVLAWLREAGHYLPTWQEQRDAAIRTYRMQYLWEAATFPLLPQPMGIAKITSID